MRDKKIVLVGATGRVGLEFLSIFYEENIPCQNLCLVASKRSIGKRLHYGDQFLEIKSLEEIDFANYNFAFFSAGSKVSELYAPLAASKNCIVIDNTSFFRMDLDIALVVPEINIESVERVRKPKIIANPNCSTIQMVMVLKPLHDIFGLKEVIVDTYQSVSGAGQNGINELLEQTRLFLEGKEIATPVVFKKLIAFNLIPQIDEFSESLYTKEELKMIFETKKILDIPDLDIVATCVRVPVLYGHSISVHAKFDKKVDLEKAIIAISNFSGVSVVDDLKCYDFITPVQVVSKNNVYVSRIRKHLSQDNSLSFWCSTDNLRKGAALNAMQIAKMLDFNEKKVKKEN